MSKFKYIIPTSLVSGGMILGAIFSPITLSGAQTDDGGDGTTVPAPESNRNQSDQLRLGNGEHRPGEHRRGGFGLEALDELGLSLEDLKAGHEAGQTLVETAAVAGISEADLLAALEQSASERLAQAVDDDRIDTDRASEIEAGMSERISERINTVHEGRPDPGRRRGPHREALIETLTELGLDEDALKAGREDGKSLAEVAAEAGVSEEALVDALIADAQEHLESAATDGRIDEDRLSQIEDHLEERISTMVNRASGERGEHEGGGPGRPRGFGDRDA